jgi:XTP/dITP diphosphohydrolase
MRHAKMSTKSVFPADFPRGKVAYFVTSNVHKFLEARAILAEYKIAAAKLKVEAVEIQNEKLENIARYSILDAVKNCGLPVFVEDAGIFIEALGGFPGPYSKYIYHTIGLDGVLKLMDDVENRDAYFMSVVCFGAPDVEPTCFVGKVKGQISSEKKGGAGFGYDPIFLPVAGDDRTFAEMSSEEKNGFSHRGMALRSFAEWFSRVGKRIF